MFLYGIRAASATTSISRRCTSAPLRNWPAVRDEALQPFGRGPHALQARQISCFRLTQGNGELRVDAG